MEVPVSGSRMHLFLFALWLEMAQNHFPPIVLDYIERNFSHSINTIVLGSRADGITDCAFGVYISNLSATDFTFSYLHIDPRAVLCCRSGYLIAQGATFRIHVPLCSHYAMYAQDI